jgi:hypothetical protein
MAISTYGIELRWGESAEAVEKVIDIKDFPDLIGEINTIETTTLSDSAQTFIPGITQSSVMTFTANFTSADFAKCKADESKPLYYELSFSDGSKFTWRGEHVLGVPGKSVDEVVEFQVNVTPSTSVDFVAAA